MVCRRQPAPACRVTLLQAVPNGKVMEAIIQKATELGVSRIVPVLTERVVPQLADRSGAHKAEKWRSVAIEAPPGHGDLVAGLVLFMERAIDYYAAALPLTAWSLADRELLRRHQALNRERGSGPQLALQATVDCLRGWQEAGYLDRAADLYPMAVALCGGALICAYIEQLAGSGQIRGGRDGLIHSLIDSAVGPYMTKHTPS